MTKDVFALMVFECLVILTSPNGIMMEISVINKKNIEIVATLMHKKVNCTRALQQHDGTYVSGVNSGYMRHF